MGECRTCGKRGADCVGHTGHVDLEAPVFHLGFLTAVLRICRTICKRCAHVLLTDAEMAYYTWRLSSKMEQRQHMDLIKHIQEEAVKTRVCVRCGALNGMVRRVRPMHIVHEKYRVELRRGEAAEEDATATLQTLMEATAYDADLQRRVEHVHEFLDPARVRELFAAIPAQQHVLLGLQPGTRPVDLLVGTLCITPVCVRPRGVTNNTTREDDITTQYNDILVISDSLKDGTSDSAKYVESWETLQARVARLLDSAMPGYSPQWGSAECKSFAQRLKGKTGRFRGNLSGKRVDFSGRSVISPDPNLGIDELAVPLHVARLLTYPQRVFRHNLEYLRRLVRNGPHVHPGAVMVYLAKERSRRSLASARDRELLAARLAVGDIVERHIINGDMILFNRQPSLHRISMMAHHARVLPYRTFRFNVCCCAPYNADFDGDEMNVHVVQTEEARAEAKELMLTAKNIINAKNGEPIIACIQDFLTALYLVTARGVFLDRSQLTQAVSHWLGTHTTYTLPVPAILKPTELWTGKQLVELIVRPAPAVPVLLNLEAKARGYSGEGKHRDVSEGYVAFLDSVLVSGRLDKKLMGGGAKEGLFARLHALAGGAYTARVMSFISQFTSRYLQNYGFSLGLGDVAPTPSLNAKKEQVLQRAFAKCDALIAEATTGRLVPLPGLTVAQSLEAKLNAELSTVRDECGSAAVETLDPATNAPLIMVNAGSKGSALNTAQMMACVGQQTVNGKRIRNAFQERSLPHFRRYAEHPAARGFVASSFYSGLKPTEFFFHTMAGREGLVDTAVKTAETGYIYRRLSKAMENLAVLYDDTVRSADGAVVQLRYGEDGLDPLLMEGSGASPLNLDQEWLAGLAIYARGQQARRACRARLQPGGAADDAYRRQHVVSLPPAEVVPFVRALLDGDAALLQELERVAAQEQADLRAAAAAGEDEPPAKAAAPPVKSAVQYLRQLMRKAASAIKFKEDLVRFFQRKVKEQEGLREALGLGAAPPPSGRSPSTRRGARRAPATAAVEADDAAAQQLAEATQTELLPMTRGMLASFLESCARKYMGKACEPGTPCGAIAAQSIGEPSTQMTLRTFHFAGVASMNITQGVPRLVEVINANRNINTPVITAPVVVQDPGFRQHVLLGEDGPVPHFAAMSAPLQQLHTARAVRVLVERVLLKEVTREMVEVLTKDGYVIHVFLNMDVIRHLLLPLNALVVRERLQEACRTTTKLRHLRDMRMEVLSEDALVVMPSTELGPAHNPTFAVQMLLTHLPDIVVGGVAGINRVMLADHGAKLIAEGSELRAVMALPHVDGTKTVCNHVAEVERTLGIEAARQVIVNEINEILKAYSLSIDIRHIYLLADVMTSRGTVLGITRYGINKMNNNVLTMASFERTTEYLHNAAVTQRSDERLSVSESIIVGKPIPLGTSSFSVLLDTERHAARQQQSGSGSGAVSPRTGVKQQATTGGVEKASGSTTARLAAKARQLRAANRNGATAIHQLYRQKVRPPLFADNSFRIDVFV
ncbi:DNA-directed RNA polymerase III subunit RPC1 [Strigomonas culicis]|uniref:DNA-directed RNA polymerase subunit n=1 Tax=Strigomonas culicis TaxID=28005 RepID=S9V097_9TRYP|nr:DNA-directed RNA polymerase III subunit RPC1 [Strigomonas culicis]|eukprot:EPY20321.1 DNA-directed RNA polymerase III subunit RPC1 [Strigomonas culicis]